VDLVVAGPTYLQAPYLTTSLAKTAPSYNRNDRLALLSCAIHAWRHHRSPAGSVKTVYFNPLSQNTEPSEANLKHPLTTVAVSEKKEKLNACS
jgi:hypothetical protein